VVYGDGRRDVLTAAPALSARRQPRPVARHGAAQAFLERHDRPVAEQRRRLRDVGLRIADVAGPRFAVDRRRRGAEQTRTCAHNSLSDTRPLVATLMIWPEMPGAVVARSTPSTTFAT
jgi:hypothetical protein